VAVEIAADEAVVDGVLLHEGEHAQDVAAMAAGELDQFAVRRLAGACGRGPGEPTAPRRQLDRSAECPPNSLNASMPVFLGGAFTVPGGLTAMPAAFSYAPAVSCRTPVAADVII
jgi:hypothetical protein